MSVLTLQERMSLKVKEKSLEKPKKLKKDLVLADYNLKKLNLDSTTLSYLEDKTIEIKEITNKAYTELGKIFTETGDKLALKGYGCFEQWYSELGFKKQTVYNYINRYKLIVQRLDKQEIIESLPLKLVYAISKDNCPDEIVNKVLNLEIKTFKEYNEITQFLLQEETSLNLIEDINYNQIEKEYKNIQNFLTKEAYNKVNNEKKKKIYNYIKKIENLLK